MKKLLVFGCVAILASAAQAQYLLYETFNYGNGDLTTVSAGLWNRHSGSGALPVNVVGQRAFIDQNDGAAGRDDDNRLLSSSFNPGTDNSSSIFAAFTVNFSALPFDGGSTFGSYFAHFNSSTANEFYARVGANQEGAASGKFRLAVANESWSTADSIEFPLDLDLNTDYLVILRLNLATDQSTLWVDPVDQASTSVTAAGSLSYSGVINAFGLRQGTTSLGGPGDLFLDNLRVGTTFNEVLVVPEPGSVILAGAFGGLLLLRRLRRRE